MKRVFMLEKLLLLLLVVVKGLVCLYDDSIGPVFIQEPPSRVDFMNEVGLHLNCTARGSGPLQVKWINSRDGQILIDVPPLRYTSLDGALLYSPFSPGGYRPDIHSVSVHCLASNSQGSILSREVQIRAVVKQPFDVQVEAGSGFYPVGGPAVLQCLIPQFVREFVMVTSWVRDKTQNILPVLLSGQSLVSQSQSQSDRTQILPDGSLLLWSVQPEDSKSSYQCRVLHKLTSEAQISSPGKLTLKDEKSEEQSSSPFILGKISNVILKQGDLLVIPCISQGHPRPNIRWYKMIENGRVPIGIDEISENHNNLRIFSKNGVLLSYSVKAGNAGLYVCNSTNPLGVDSMQVQLTVRVPLQLTVEPESGQLTVDVGKNAKIFCKIDQNFENFELKWFKNGQRIVLSDRVRFVGDGQLQIQGVRREDEGTYQCLAKNQFESVQKSIQLSLGDSYPVMIYKFIEQTLRPGPQISLKCVAKSNPEPEVKWTLDGFPLHASERYLIGQFTNIYGDMIAHFNITSVRAEDGGEIQCTFRNRAGETSHSAPLNIYGPPFVRPMPEVLAVAGKDLFIKCPVGGYPIETIDWFKDGVKLPVSPRQVVWKGNGTLKIYQVQKDMHGLYSCTASNRKSESSSRSVSIKVMVPPKITPFTFAPDLVAGERAVIQCVVVKGDTPIKFTWFWSKFENEESSSNGGKSKEIQMLPIIESHHLKRHPGKITIRQMDDDHFSSALVISRLEPEFSSNITCKAENSIGFSQHSAQLIVHVPPRISPFFFEEGLQIGMRTQVMCSVNSATSQPFSLKFFKNGILHKLDSSIQLSQFSPFSVILSLVNLTEDHRGNWSCRAENMAGIAEQFSNLVINVPPKWSLEPSSQSIGLGQWLAIDCQAKGYPAPQASWKRRENGGNGEKKDFFEIGGLNNNPGGILIGGNGTLIFSRVGKNHEGEYLCQINNGIGIGLSKLIQLKVHAKPHIKPRNSAKEMARKGDRVRLTCEVDEGDEPIRISWRVRGVLYDGQEDGHKNPRYSVENSGSNISHLSIMNVSPEDRVKIECQAQNPYGQDTTTITLLVQEKPPAPANLRVLGEKSSRSLNLQWNLPAISEDLDILEFILQFRIDSEEWTENSANKVSVSGESTSMVVHGLSPHTNYEFRIFARNLLGLSEKSEVLKITTDMEPPSGSPLDIHVEPSLTYLKVSWTPPELGLRNGQILGYLINFRRKSTSLDLLRDPTDIPPSSLNWTKIEILGESKRTTIVKNLPKFTNFEISLQAFNSKGPGPMSPPVEMRTLEDVPTMPPGEIRCTALNSQSLQLSWVPPPSDQINGVIQFYKIFIELIQDPDSPDNYLDSGGDISEVKMSSLSTVVHGLDHWTNYSVQVSAWTRVGQGLLSAPIFCRTKESVPAAPTAIKSVWSSKDSAIISWLPPRKRNGRLLKYHIYIRIGEAGSGREIRTPKKTIPSHPTGSQQAVLYEVRDLKRREIYEVWVTCETSVGESQSSKSVSFTVGSSSDGGSTIVSFGKVWTIGWKSDVKLPCDYVSQHLAGNSKSGGVIWKKRDLRIVESSRVQVVESQSAAGDFSSLIQNSLLITNVGKTESGNYSCHNNGDLIIHQLIVQVPPSAPLLHATSVTSSSVRVQWKAGDSGGSRIRGFSLNFRPAEGEWEEIQIGRQLSAYELTETRCGTLYEFYLTGYNKIGQGSPSERVKVRTNGSPPHMGKTGSEIIQTNSTAINFQIFPPPSWDSQECKITHSAEYREKNRAFEWTSVEKIEELDGKWNIDIGGLRADTLYEVRLVGENDAGKSSVTYEITTMPLKGGISSNFKSDTPFYRDLQIVLPSIVSLCAILTSLVTLCLCWRKRIEERSLRELSIGNSIAMREKMQPGDPLPGSEREYTMIRSKYLPEQCNCDHLTSERTEDLYPYATFDIHSNSINKGNFGHFVDSMSIRPPPDQFACHMKNPPLPAPPFVNTGRYSGPVPGQLALQHQLQVEKKFRSRSSVKSKGQQGQGQEGFSESDEYDSIRESEDSEDSDSTYQKPHVTRSRSGSRFGTLSGLETLVIQDKSLPRRNKQQNHRHMTRHNSQNQKLTLPLDDPVPVLNSMKKANKGNTTTTITTTTNPHSEFLRSNNVNLNDYTIAV